MSFLINGKVLFAHHSRVQQSNPVINHVAILFQIKLLIITNRRLNLLFIEYLLGWIPELYEIRM